MTAPLTGIEACVFDAYGTLFDFATAAERSPDIPDDHRGALTALWRDKQLQYTWRRTLQGRYTDFWQVTGDALDYALDSLGIDDRAARDQLMNLYLTLEPFEDVAAALPALRKRGLRTAILSNGSPAMLAPLLSAAGLNDADQAGSAGKIGEIGGMIEADAKMVQMLARAEAPPIRKLTLLLRLAAGETAPLGPAADKAKAEALKLLRVPETRSGIAADPEALKQIRGLMMATGLAA